MTKDELSESEIKLLEDLTNNVRLLPRDIRNAIKHVLEIVKADRKADEEPKPNFKVGDKVVVTSDNDFFVPYVGKIVSLDEDSAYITIGRGRINVPIDRLTPYTEPTAEERKEKEQSGYLDFSKGIKAVLDGDFKPIDTTPIKTNPIRIINDDWQSYRMELAKAVAPALIGSNYESTAAFDVESFNDDVVRIVDGIVERLKMARYERI